jgi:hypothetical protein
MPVKVHPQGFKREAKGLRKKRSRENDTVHDGINPSLRPARLAMPLQFLPSCIHNICREIASLKGDSQGQLNDYGTMKTPIRTTQSEPVPKPVQRKLGANHGDLAPKPRKHHSNFKQSNDLREDRGIRQIKSERKRDR